MARREALGKGISALIPEAANLDTGTSLFYCPIALIRPNPHQPRKDFQDSSLKELADSIREKGILTPLLVTRVEECYVLIAGERRWRAAQLAGLERVPVIVKEATEPEHLELALIENLHRKDLNPLEEAEAYQRLLQLTGETQEDLAKRIGKDRSTIANALRILRLPKEIQSYVLEGKLTMGHARVLVGIQDLKRQKELAKEAVEKDLSVRQLEKLAKKAQKRPKESKVDAALLSVIDHIKTALATKVELKPSKKGGRIVLHYASQEELQRILELLLTLGDQERQ